MKPEDHKILKLPGSGTEVVPALEKEKDLRSHAGV
jgi:hypothetical protein